MILTTSTRLSTQARRLSRRARLALLPRPASLERLPSVLLVARPRLPPQRSARRKGRSSSSRCCRGLHTSSRLWLCSLSRHHGFCGHEAKPSRLRSSTRWPRRLYNRSSMSSVSYLPPSEAVSWRHRVGIEANILVVSRSCDYDRRCSVRSVYRIPFRAVWRGASGSGRYAMRLECCYRSAQDH